MKNIADRVNFLDENNFKYLTLPAAYISESLIWIKIDLNFMKNLEAFIKPFEAPQSSLKIKI